MLSQIFCYWDKQQSAESNITQFYLTLKCTEDQSSHFCDCVLVSKWISQHHDRGLTKFHTGSEQLLVCVVINNASFLTVKNNNTAYHAFVKYWMQVRGLLNYRLKYCWPKMIYCICQPNEIEREIKKKTGGPSRGPSKNLGGMAPPAPPLRIATGCENERLWSLFRCIFSNRHFLPDRKHRNSRPLFEQRLVKIYGFELHAAICC